MIVDVITIFPEMFAPFVRVSLMGRAAEAGMVQVQVHNLRDWTTDRHHVVDDTPFGGGGGMVLMAGPIVEAVESLVGDNPSATIVIPTARGPLFDQAAADRLAQQQRLVFVCGHYKGIDERAFDVLQPERFSVGDYVLTGGELPSMIIIDAIVRRIPGFIGNADSAEDDSFNAIDEEFGGRLLGPPVYTRPAEFRGLQVPDVLISGHHARVRDWRREQAVSATREFRPDLLSKEEISEGNC
jgi:tRNA (guanine37-N1)-methyltransferase